MAEWQETINDKKETYADDLSQSEPINTERSHLMQANITTKGMMAGELMAEGVGRESVARVLHVTPAELEDLLDKSQQQLSLKQGESA